MSSTIDRPATKRPSARASGRGPARPRIGEPASRAHRVALGKDARAVAPLESHAQFESGAARDPVGLLLGQAQSRVAESLTSAFLASQPQRLTVDDEACVGELASLGLP